MMRRRLRACRRLAQFSAGRMLNGVAEGTALAVCAWMLLRVVRRPNSSTRFAVWFVVLLVSCGAALYRRSSRRRRRSWIREFGVPDHVAWLGGRFAIFAVWAAMVGMGSARGRVAPGFWQITETAPGVALRSISTTLIRQCGRRFEEFHRFRPVQLCASDRVRGADGNRILQPAVIVPAWALHELSAEELHSVVLHELAHLRRWDDWTNLAQEVLGALFFFHPAVWWIGSRLSLEREMACDDLVLAQTANSARLCAMPGVGGREKSSAARTGAGPGGGEPHAAHFAARGQILDRNRPGATRVWRPAWVW